LKLRVNLYVQALQPVKEKVSLKLLVSTCLVLSLLLSATSRLITTQTEAKKAELATLQKQLKSQEQQLKQLQDNIGKRQPSAALVKQQADLKQTITQKQKLLKFVQNEQQKVSVHYAPVFRYLAEIDPTGFWLESFSLTADASQFSGYVTEPELLPGWLNQLGKTDFFKGHSFSQFEIKQLEQKEALAFKVTSLVTAAEKQEVAP
jgi:exonuclease VII large subunit